jgi:type IV pilus assembly protein PilM
MAKGKKFLALDIGANQITMAEFVALSNGGLELQKYAFSPVSADGESDVDMGPHLALTVNEMMREHGFRPGPLMLSVSGQIVFPRFVKLPPVSRDKISQIVEYEAEQNVPFPIDEVVWDYQLLSDDDADMDVMLVAVKAELVQKLTDAVEGAGLEPRVVDVAPFALYNACRYNYEDDGECTMILDVGARSSNLVFLEGDRIFTRSIPVAGNAVTQELMKEFDLDFAEAEKMKVEEGFVSPGGTTSTGDPNSDHISKSIRTVMTRLHAEINRSINFYRSQQDGSRPTRALLTGGSSAMPGIADFFSDKLKIEVEHLNPFEEVAVAESIDAEDIDQDYIRLGEVVGTALRMVDAGAININLMPRGLVARKTFRRRVPFLVASAVGLILTVLCWWLNYNLSTDVYGELQAEVDKRKDRLSSVGTRQAAVLKEQEKAHVHALAFVDLIDSRTEWLEVHAEIRTSLLDGMWLVSISPMRGRGGVINGVAVKGFGFVDVLKKFDSADASSIEVFRDRLSSSPYFDAEEIKITGEGEIDEGYAKEFTLQIGLAEPIDS